MEQLNILEKTLQEWFSKFPPLPTNAKEIIVKIAPWLALIFGVLGIISAITASGILGVLSIFVGFNGLVSALFWLASSILMLMSYPGLRDRKAKGWKMSFYSELVSVAGSIISLQIAGAVIGALIGFYILFQVKSYYK